MGHNLSTIAPQTIPKEVEDFMKTMFGEVVPMRVEEQEKFVIDLANLATRGIPPPPTLPLSVNQISETESIPTIHVPTSVYMFFRSEWKKQKKEVRNYNVADKSGNKGARDAYVILWRSLTLYQKENWSRYFVFVRNQREELINLGYFKRAPSAYQLKKESRKRRYSTTSSSVSTSSNGSI